MAAAKPGIQKIAHVLKLLDESEEPNYKQVGFSPGGRALLFDDVRQVSLVMFDPVASEGWQPMILNVRVVAEQTNAYFDEARPNSALDEFLQDWDKVRDLAG